MRSQVKKKEKKEKIRDDRRGKSPSWRVSERFSSWKVAWYTYRVSEPG